jgi:hypothetical protein
MKIIYFITSIVWMIDFIVYTFCGWQPERFTVALAFFMTSIFMFGQVINN